MGKITVQKTTSLTDQMRTLEDRIMQRAYDISLGNGAMVGNEIDHWLAAERELVWKPAIQIKEQDRQIEIQVAVAGIDPKDIKVEVTAEHLLVRGETRTQKTENKADKGSIYTCELQSADSLFRSIQLPKKIDPDQVKADLKNGLLTITAPIAAAAEAPAAAVVKARKTKAATA